MRFVSLFGNSCPNAQLLRLHPHQRSSLTRGSTLLLCSQVLNSTPQTCLKRNSRQQMGFIPIGSLLFSNGFFFTLRGGPLRCLWVARTLYKMEKESPEMKNSYSSVSAHTFEFLSVSLEAAAAIFLLALSSQLSVHFTTVKTPENKHFFRRRAPRDLRLVS